eukprot:gb/GECH01004961.1/.p1 GENE.gb/GECH01004961.1/~~gb/GECH01004961.1/.p1  ORF type:complete len:328 (+),score=53.42 gb/GECH01004961.1/:1-984(+)
MATLERQEDESFYSIPDQDQDEYDKENEPYNTTPDDLLSFTSSSSMGSEASSTQPLEDKPNASPRCRIDLSQVEHGVNIYPVLYDNNTGSLSPIIPDLGLLSDDERTFTEDSISSVDTEEENTMTPIGKKHDKAVKDDKHAEPLVHRTQPGDTLAGLSLRYDVSIQELKQANDIIATGESDVLAVEEVVVPCQHHREVDSPPEHKSSAELLWEQRRQQRMERMAVVLFARSKNIPQDEAKYYLLLHDYDCQAAAREYAADMAWEARREAVQGAKKRRRLMRELQRYGCCVPLLVRTMGGGEEDTVLGYDDSDDDDDDDGVSWAMEDR